MVEKSDMRKVEQQVLTLPGTFPQAFHMELESPTSLTLRPTTLPAPWVFSR